MTWTHFWDMHSGGYKKLKWGHIFIEADEEEAVAAFSEFFNRDPYYITCGCCGQDYDICESNESLEQITAYQRHCAYAYFNPKGEEVSKEEAWASGKGYNKGFYGTYVERQRYFETPLTSASVGTGGIARRIRDGVYQSLAEFELNEDVLIIRRIKELEGPQRLKLSGTSADPDVFPNVWEPDDKYTN